MNAVSLSLKLSLLSSLSLSLSLSISLRERLFETSVKAFFSVIKSKVR